MKSLVFAACLSAALLVSSLSVAAGDDETDVFARVVVAETELRAGPGISYRVIHRAHRGDAFLIETRETAGYWLEVLLPDGRSAFILGDTIEPVAVNQADENAPSKPGLFAPPALEDANAGLALQSDSRRILYGGAFALNVAPDWAVAPFMVLGMGGMQEIPKEENIRQERSWFHARVGGGFLISLRFRLLVRLEFSDFVLFTEDRYRNVQSYTGGLGSYF